MNVREAFVEANPYKLLLSGVEISIPELLAVYGDYEAVLTNNSHIERDESTGVESVVYGSTVEKIAIQHTTSRYWFYLDVLHF